MNDKQVYTYQNNSQLMRAKKIFEEEFHWIKNNKSKEDIEKSFEGAMEG